MAAWRVEGQYMETCNCTFLCPCISSNLTARPTEGECKVAVAMKIDKGEKDGVKLDGLSFIVLMHSPKARGEGGMTVGLIVDERATDKQTEAIGAIASGTAGGPLAALGPLVAKMAGVEKRPITFEVDGLKRRVRAGNLIDQACEGVPGPVRAGEPIYLDNTCHPVSPKLALASSQSIPKACMRLRVAFAWSG